MPSEEQLTLIKKIGEVLIANDLGDVPVEIYRENVCPLNETKVTNKTLLKVTKDLPSSKADQANKFKEEVKPLIEGIAGLEISVVAKLGAGDVYQAIKNVTPMDKEEKCDLTHTEGQVWLIDFWATWCPPCQKPMAHNQEMLEKRAADWGDKVRIIGVSIDSVKDTLAKHITAKGWEKVEHYFRGESDCSEVYGVKGVPHVMLIDTKGNIAFKGHPANRPDLEKDFDALLKGETLTGEGCGPVKQAEGGEEAKEDGWKELDGDACMKEIDGFTAVGEALQKDDVMKGFTKTLMRCFCVMVYKSKYVPSTGKSTQNYENYRVLVGP